MLQLKNSLARYTIRYIFHSIFEKIFRVILYIRESKKLTTSTYQLFKKKIVYPF